MVGIRSPTNCQANGLNHSSRGQRPRKKPIYLLRPVRAIHKGIVLYRSISTLRTEHRPFAIHVRPIRPIGHISPIRPAEKSEILIHHNFPVKPFQGVPRRSKPFQTVPSHFKKKKIVYFLCVTNKTSSQAILSSVLFVPSVSYSDFPVHLCGKNSQNRGIKPKSGRHKPKIFRFRTGRFQISLEIIIVGFWDLLKN
jgi:hypothetical protein